MIIHAQDYGIKPDCLTDQCQVINQMLVEIKAKNEPCTLLFEKGIYYLNYHEAPQIKAYISNTTSEKENADVKKTVALLIDGHENLIIDGNGSKFIIQGKMTEIVVQNSKHVTIRNLTIDYERPTVSEFTLINRGWNYLDIRIHSDSWYKLKGRKIDWYGHNWQSKGNLCVQYSAINKSCKRIFNPLTLAYSIQKLDQGILRVKFPFLVSSKKYEINDVFQVRDSIRDQVGAWINHATDVVFEKINFNFMHGLGVVAQQSKHLKFKNLQFKPDPSSRRTCAAFADFLHLSGCSGQVVIDGCYFAGAHDDCVNIHGTHLKVISQINSRTLKVRYMHPQTYGFTPYKMGDQIALVMSKSLQIYGKYIVKDCIQKSEREYTIELFEPITKLEPNTVVDNLSEKTEVSIVDNVFSQVPTRGVLLTNGKKAVIKGNQFVKTKMSGILIANDASSWYESGAVNDVTITENIFEDCGSPTICICPENKHNAGSVHHNLKITNNVFKGSETKTDLYFKSVSGLEVSGNEKEAGTLSVTTKWCENTKVEGE